MNKAKPTFSFEFFPAKTSKGVENLKDDAKALSKLDPKFMTVTYGACGSSQDLTFDLVKDIQASTNVPMATHLTYINTPRQDMYKLADQLWADGIRHIVALRGDMPDDLQWPLDVDTDYFQYTSHFVVALKARQNFEISVGAYPEKHPDAPSLNDDIIALKKKFDAGADRAITQFFFNNQSYYDFLEATAKQGINKPIVPGILPIYDLQKMMGFAKTCHAHVPDNIIRRFDNASDEDALKIAEEIFISQIHDLKDNGVENFHIYTMNKTDLISKLYESL